MIILGLTTALHDCSAAIVVDGKIVAASAEERFNRQKHTKEFPRNAIKFCLRCVGIDDINAIEEIAIGMRWVERGEARFKMRTSEQFPEFTKIAARKRSSDIHHAGEIENILRNEFAYQGPIKFYDHHDCHAAPCYFPSGYSTAAIVTIDGSGEQAATRINIAKGTEIKRLLEIQYPNSLGRFYGVITDYLGFRTEHEEGIVMSLAAYGNDIYHKELRDILKVEDDGTYKLDFDYFDFQKASNLGVSSKFIERFGPRRSKEEKIDQRHKDIANSAQSVFQEAVIALINLAKKLTGEDNLCMAGGAVLNSVTNAKVTTSNIFKNVYFYPAPGDDGASAGAALKSYYGRNNTKLVSWKQNQSPFLGQQAYEPEILAALEKYKLDYKKPTNIYQDVAILLTENKFIGWYSGRAEFGPRALGNRSILASPRNSVNRDLLNNKVKLRESFRPFAPSVLEEFADEYFHTQGRQLPYMLVTVDVKDDKKDAIPAVVHVDGTARIQTVNEGQNHRFWKLINEFYRITEIPVILNTSFNRKGEPIVNTPDEAIECFLRSGLDAIALEDYLVIR